MQSVGLYWVIVTDSLGCTSDTATYDYVSTSTTELLSNKMLVYPNPTEGNISVDLRENYSNVIIELTDILGRKIKTNSYVQGQHFNYNINEEAGIYFLTVIAENKKVVFRVVKN